MRQTEIRDLNRLVVVIWYDESTGKINKMEAEMKNGKVADFISAIENANLSRTDVFKKFQLGRISHRQYKNDYWEEIFCE